MTFIETSADERREHPVDVVERLASVNDWAFDRAETDEISILVSGRFANYDVAFTWLPDLESLHVSCSFDLKVPQHKRAAIGELTQLINEQLWLGHFDQWSQQDVVMFRHALVPRRGRWRERRAMRRGGQGGARRLRDLLPSVPVRLMGQSRPARGDRLRRVRDPRRGLTRSPAGRKRAPSGSGLSRRA